MRLQPISRLSSSHCLRCILHLLHQNLLQIRTSHAVMVKAAFPSKKALMAAARTPSVRRFRNAVMAKTRVSSRALSVWRPRKALMAKSRVSSKKAPRAVARRRPSGAPGWRRGRRPRISGTMIVGRQGRRLGRCPSGSLGRR